MHRIALETLRKDRQAAESIFHRVDPALHTENVTRGRAGDPKVLPSPKDIDGIRYARHAKYHDGCLPLRELLQADVSGLPQVGAVIFQTAERYGLYVVGMIRRTPASLDPRQRGRHLEAQGKPDDFLMQLTVCRGNEAGERRLHYVGGHQLDGIALMHGHPFVKDIPHVATTGCFFEPIAAAVPKPAA